MFNPTTAQRVNERYRRLLINSGWVLPESGAALKLFYDFSAQPNLDPQINPATGAPAGPPLNITRTTTKKFSDWEGILRPVLTGEATFKGCRRVENKLLQHSEDFGDAGWAKSNCTISQDTSETLDPFGNNNAAKMTDDATDNRHNVSDASMIIANSTYSIYVKSDGTHQWVLLSSHVTSAPGLRGVYFDIINGVVGTEGTTEGQGSITDEGNGWFRLSITEGTSPSSIFSFLMAGADNDDSYIGTGTSVYIFGAQWEETGGQADRSASEYQKIVTTRASRNYAIQKNGLPLPTIIVGLTTEASRTNICLQSEDLSTTWVNATSIDTQAAGTAPDGTNTANRIVDDASTGEGSAQVRQDLTIATSTVFVYSGYFKADQDDWVNLVVSNLGTLVISAYFDLTNGVVGPSTGANNTSEFIEDVGNGWFRCGIKFTSDASDSSGRLRVYVAEGDNDIAYEMDGTNSILVWGIQLEASGFQTSYIPTTTASVTRNVDDVSSTDLSWFNAGNPGSLFMSVGDTGGVSLSPSNRLIDIGSVASGSVILHTNSGSRIRATVDGGGTAGLITGPSNFMDDGELHLVTLGWATNYVIGFIDGEVIGPNTALTTLPSPANEFSIGIRTTGVSPATANIASIRYYDALATDSELDDLSNGLLAP